MKTRALPFILTGSVALMLLFGVANAQDARSQLQLLQRMYKEGLITKDVYEQKQREVLGAGKPSAEDEPPTVSPRPGSRPLPSGERESADTRMTFGDVDNVHPDKTKDFELTFSNGVVHVENYSGNLDSSYLMDRTLPNGEHKASVEISSEVVACSAEYICGVGFIIHKRGDVKSDSIFVAIDTAKKEYSIYKRARDGEGWSKVASTVGDDIRDGFNTLTITIHPTRRMLDIEVNGNQGTSINYTPNDNIGIIAMGNVKADLKNWHLR
jgi:hypothetical protein